MILGVDLQLIWPPINHPMDETTNSGDAVALLNLRKIREGNWSVLSPPVEGAATTRSSEAETKTDDPLCADCDDGSPAAA